MVVLDDCANPEVSRLGDIHERCCFVEENNMEL